MSDKKDSPGSFWSTLPGIITAIAGLLTAVGGFVAILYSVHVLPLATPTAPAPLASEVPSAVASIAPDESPTAIVITATPATADPSERTDRQGVPMRLVPAGSFTMGSLIGDTNEQPVHTVNVSAFYIDKYEVTNARYKACVDEAACQPPSGPSSSKRTSYYGNPEFADYPVIYVNWNMAQAYCAWRGVRLPTEAEWEKAARGVDGRTYPWGEGISCSQANYKSCGNDTSKVGSFESGKSPFGVYDMSGNVWEWVSDWYLKNYYSAAGNNASDPTGPASGDGRVIRGGSWSNTDKNVRATIRNNSDPAKTYNFVGFRCASPAP